MKPKPATASRRYVEFKNDLNRALDVLHNRAQLEVTDLLRGAFTRTLEIIALRYSALGSDLMTPQARQALKSIDEEIDRTFQLFGQQVLAVMVKLGKKAYTLSKVGNAEALGRATGKIQHYNVTRDEALKVAARGLEGESQASRVMLIFDRLRRKILNAVELSMIQGETPKEALVRVTGAFPKKRLVKKPKRLIKPIEVREAEEDLGSKLSLSVGFVTDEEWDEIVQDYLTDYIPKWRGPETVFDLPDPEGGPDLEERYGWELEKYMADDFVRKVREDKPKGITDFMWIAVVDDKTDECCLWRDGLTSEQIEGELKGKHKNDECDAIVPPAHFNCRCDMAPMIAEMPEVEPSNLQSFEEWLNS